MTIKISSPSTPSSPTSGQPAVLGEEEQSNKKERRLRRTKQKMEYELDEIFRRLCNGESDFQIMTTLNLQERNYYKYKKRLEARLMEYQIRKTDNTLFLECHLFKNRMLKLYKALETKALDDKTSGVETAKCCEVAANIAIDVLKLESEGIRAVKELGLAEKAAAVTTTTTTTKKSNNNNNANLKNDLRKSDNDYDDAEVGPADSNNSRYSQLEEDDNRKF